MNDLYFITDQIFVGQFQFHYVLQCVLGIAENDLQYYDVNCILYFILNFWIKNIYFRITIIFQSVKNYCKTLGKHVFVLN